MEQTVPVFNGKLYSSSHMDQQWQYMTYICTNFPIVISYFKLTSFFTKHLQYYNFNFISPKQLHVAEFFMKS